MKKFTAIIMALVMVLGLTQCRPDKGNEGDTQNGSKVKVSCVVPMNKGTRSEFDNLMTDGKIKWSAGTERIYLAIPDETNPQIVEMTAFTTVESNILAFEGEVAEGLLKNGEYDIWYFGNSKESGNSYIAEEIENDVIKSISGSIASQSGDLEDLGYCHIAKTTVTAETKGEEVVLSMNGTLKNQIAIAHLNLEGITQLKGDAIVGTEYTLQYVDGTFEFAVAPSSTANITVTEGTTASYVVLLPNATANVDLKSNTSKKVTFEGGVEANKIYYKHISDMEYYPLAWEEYEETTMINGHEYVDLGLPSGLLWATCNVGAETPEGYGDYYGWGCLNPDSNGDTYGKNINDISGNSDYDVATLNWGSEWRMPRIGEFDELLNNCTWTWTTQNDVDGYKVTGPNGNSIFLPACGYNNGSSFLDIGICYYWTSAPVPYGDLEEAFMYILNGYYDYRTTAYRPQCNSIRPVFGGNFDGPAAQYASVTTSEVTEITGNSAICGGNVTTDNGSAVTAKGVCWSTSQNPTVENNKTEDGSGIGVYTSYMTNLEPNTTYYVRAYATNVAGTSYGEEKTFTTLAKQINEINGHEYVDLGLPSGLLWATCNVGAETPEGYGDYYGWGCLNPDSNGDTYGKNINDISGNSDYDVATLNWGSEWRMPRIGEFDELLNNCTWTWTTQNDVDGYKVTGPNGNSIFLPACGYNNGSSFLDIGICYYWTSAPVPYGDLEEAFMYILNGYYDYRATAYRPQCNSIRPVSGGNFEEPAAQYASVTTSEVAEITSNSAICGGHVATDNGSAVTARGVCWSTSQNPTISNNKTTDGSGVGSFTSTLSNLAPQTTYYVRAYVTNAAGTSYGKQKTFTTKASNIINGHEYVDLGLSVKWATCNVGAETPERYGNYYAWGEVETKSEYTQANSLRYRKKISDFSGNPTYDVASFNWGGDWRMPTRNEILELKNNCTWIFTTQNGVKGCKVEGPNGNSIFIPAAGYYDESSLKAANIGGYYWSSTPENNDSYYITANCFYLEVEDSYHSVTANYRNRGFAIRPVIK